MARNNNNNRKKEICVFDDNNNNSSVEEVLRRRRSIEASETLLSMSQKQGGEETEITMNNNNIKKAASVKRKRKQTPIKQTKTTTTTTNNKKKKLKIQKPSPKQQQQQQQQQHRILAATGTTKKTSSAKATTTTKVTTVAAATGAAATAQKKTKKQNPKIRRDQSDCWLNSYEQLLQFRLENGHCFVPNEYDENRPLGEWVKRQRYQYKLRVQLGKPSSMTDVRIDALEALGFQWNSHDSVWEERYQELCQYKEDYGDTYVPSNFKLNPSLGTWVKRQRRQYTLWKEGSDKSTMTAYRFNKLNGIEFSWYGRRST